MGQHRSQALAAQNSLSTGSGHHQSAPLGLLPHERAENVALASPGLLASGWGLGSRWRLGSQVYACGSCLGRMTKSQKTPPASAPATMQVSSP